MGDSKETRRLLLAHSATLFNLNGYKATSLGDITKSTGLTKGAIYRHFGSKENLECEALSYMMDDMMTSVGKLVRAEDTCRKKLVVVIDYFSAYTVNPPFKGGCPLMNAGTEADDAHPQLKKVVSKTMTMLHSSLVKILENGRRHEQVSADVDSSNFASVFVSSLEGAIVMMNVTGDKDHLRNVVNYLKKEVERLTTEK